MFAPDNHPNDAKINLCVRARAHTHTHQFAILSARYTPEGVGDPPFHFGHNQISDVSAMATLWVDNFWTQSHDDFSYGLGIGGVNHARQILQCRVFFHLV